LSGLYEFFIIFPFEAYRDFLLYGNYSRVAILYSDRDHRDQNGSDTLDADRQVLKGAIHLQDLLLREDVDVHFRRLRLRAVVSITLYTVDTLNGITLGQIETENVNRMKTILKINQINW
jgi:hypothetical protein